VARSREIREVTRKLKERCGIIAETLRFRGLASEQELAAYLPGGEENKEASELEAWIFTVSNYTRFCERLGDGSPKPDESAATMSDALSDAPEIVRLSSGDTAAVYPKSFTALRFIGNCDKRIGWLIKKRDAVIAREKIEDFAITERTEEEIAFQYGLMVWAAVYPEPGLPYSVGEPPKALPDFLANLSTTDYTVIHAAFMKANATRLYLLVKMLSGKSAGEDSSSRHSWETYFAVRAEESHLSTGVLMNDRSLASQLASSILVAEARPAPESDRVS
jgi:hypothetical protein